MKRRGRPRSPDILTPREWQVLGLLREDLSNEAIAERLAVSTETVKSHVASILLKLGVENRHEAARWRPEPRKQRVWLGALVPADLVARLKLHGIVYAAGVTAIAVAGVLVGLLVWGVAHNTSRSGVAIGEHDRSLLLGRVAYVHDDDIWIKELPDGASTRLTNHATDDANDPSNSTAYARPAWSPSGAWLTVLKNKQPEVIRADGTDARLYNVSPGGLVWSPTADRLAYTTDDRDLVVENADGSDAKTVATWHAAPGLTGGLSNAVWSADGAQLAYVEERAQPGPPLKRVYAGVWRVAADGSGVSAAVYSAGSPPQDGVGIVGWSGSDFIWFYRVPSFTADLADGVALQQTEPVSGTVFHLAPHFLTSATSTPAPPYDSIMLIEPELRSTAPTGDLLAVTDGAGRETWTGKSIAVVSAANATITDLTASSVAAVEPSWSPDGQKIAFASAPEAGVDISGDEPTKAALAQRRIWVMGGLGGNARQLSTDPTYRDEFPQWSPDGSQILFARLDKNDRWSLWLMPSNGGGANEVVPDISPNILGSTAPAWFGFYGTIAWHDVMDWWRPHG